MAKQAPDEMVWTMVTPSGARMVLEGARDRRHAGMLALNACGPELLSQMELRYMPRSEVGRGLCDFCITPGAEWEYLADSFTHLPDTGFLGQPVAAGSDESWLACKLCHEAFQTGGLEAVIKRTVAAQMALYPEMLKGLEKELTDATRATLEKFHFLRRGAPRRLETGCKDAK